MLRPALVLLGSLTILTGVVYPLAVTAVAQTVFPFQANGSVMDHAGSILIGQPFDDPRYFWSRPSATAPAYNASASGGSNLGPSNPALHEAIAQRVAALRAGEDPHKPVPVDLVTSSASGLDPHISPAAAHYQIARIARVRGLTVDTLRALVDKHTQPRQLGVLGEPVVNVLQLNLELDRLK